MKKMVLVPVEIQVPTPCANQQILVALVKVKLAPSHPLRRAPISHNFPVVRSRAVPANRGVGAWSAWVGVLSVP